jgi:hypothetical protein
VPAKTIFTGISVLLGVCLFFSPSTYVSVTFYLQAAKDIITSYGVLVNLFERIQMFLQRLGIYIGIPLTEAMTELLGKIMAQVISILALSTKAMTQGRISK